MPSPATAPKPTPIISTRADAPPPALAPAPGPEYNPAEHLAGKQTLRDPALTAALNKAAGVKAPPVAQPPAKPDAKSTPPVQSPATAETPSGDKAAPPADDDTPAPHVKFIPSDERGEEPPPATPDPEPADLETSVPAKLRDLYRETKKQRDEILRERDLTKKEAAEYRAKLSDYETRLKASEGAQDRLKEMERTLLDREERLRIADYTRSPDFHDKYVKPVANAMSEANEMIGQLMVQDAGGTRLGTPDDFAEVVSQPNYTLALDKAVERFGERFGQTVFEAAKKVQLAQRQHAKAIKDAAASSESWLKQQQSENAARRTQRAQQFDMAVEQLGERQRAAYLPPEGDKEAAEVYEKHGKGLVSWVRDGTPEGTPPEVALAKWAQIAHRVASWPLQELAKNRLARENEALKAKLAAYERSEPQVDGRGSSDGRPPAGANSAGQTADSTRDEMRSKLLEYSKRGGSR